MEMLRIAEVWQVIFAAIRMRPRAPHGVCRSGALCDQPSRARLRRHCGATEVQRVAQDAPRWLAWIRKIGRLRRHHWGAGPPTPRFRTIQVCPKDLPTIMRQVERAVDRPAAPRREDAPDVQREATRVHHAARRRCGRM